MKTDTQATSSQVASGPTPYDPARSALTRALFDALALTTAVAAGFGIRFGLGLFEVTESSPLTVRSHLAAAGVWIGAVMASMAVNRLYDEDTLFPGGGEIARVLRSVLEGAALIALFVFLTQSFYVSRSWFALTAVASLLLLALERVAMRRALAARREGGRFRRPAILVSAHPGGWEEWPLESETEFTIVRHVAPEDFESFAEAESRELRGAAVILRARDSTSDQFWSILVLAGQKGWSVFVHSPVRSVGRDRLTLRELGGQTIVKVAPPVLSGARATQKRVFDVVVSALLLVLLSPLLLAIAIAVLVTSGRPVLYSQERVGRAGSTFRILKFRTMRSDAEAATGPVWAADEDPRVTRIGAFLRRTSLDELPQLLNVARGHMSLVGPRPERPHFVGEFNDNIAWYRFRHRIRPGMTGWAQSHGLRGNTPLDPRIEYDNWYIENWSLWLDVKILWRTLSTLRGS